ncbi:hypothetical protein [Prevotella sp. 10(H)]|uniref:hypothetical protein n=1 Tax=Prevotella sp. 10(H) TaxID=1158294 RepID=UPI0004A6A9F3|nr:hypothetical protein [Prevotella sp. 10(H)]
MKLKTIILSVMIALLAGNVYSQDKKDAEIVSYYRTRSGHNMKTVRYQNEDGKCTQMITYVRKSKDNWEPVKKYVYDYDKEGNLINMTYSEWNQRSGRWSEAKSQLVYNYDSQGELIAMKQVNIYNRCNKEVDLLH